MLVHLEVTDRSGYQEHNLDTQRFWIGSHKSNTDIELDLPGCQGRVLEVRAEADTGLAVRVEAGLPFPVRSVSGTVGTRFEPVLDGDVLNVGPALVKIRLVDAGQQEGQTLDPALLRSAETAAGAPVGGWYDTFMEIADTLEALQNADRMIRAVMEGILGATGVDRVFVQLEGELAGSGAAAYYMSAPNHDEAPFRVSQSILTQATDTRQVVHVPLASADPVASQFVSVRSEGISSSIALPLRALGKNLGVLYADCVREGATLTAADLQRIVFVGRLLASALGNRDLVANLVKAEPAMDAAAHPALQTSSPACAEMVERVKLYAPTEYTVLVRGETGTGKEVMARALHALSRRKSGPFVAVNCAAIPAQLMESILFGHEKGSFTGATEARRGHFEEANGGTLLLDEIGDMAADLQAKILRVLQDRVVTPVGSNRHVEVDVRILAATHQDLERLVREGQFREDLYFRLRELELQLPALRERTEDVLPLSSRFLAEASRELGYKRVPDLAAETLQVLQRRSWRGNIRELRHVIKGAALNSGGGPILPSHIEPDRPREATAAAVGAEPAMETAATYKQRLAEEERRALAATLSEAGGNLTKAAALFGVPRTTYREKLLKAGLLDKQK